MSDPLVATVCGDANETSIGITKPTFDRLLKMEHPDRCIALYAFCAYTARWQRSQQAKCTVAFISKALGWSDSTTARAKAQLVAAGLIENVKRTDPATGQVTGWYVRVRYLVNVKDVHPVPSDGVVHPVRNPGGGNQTPKCLGTSSLNARETGISPRKFETPWSDLPSALNTSEFKDAWDDYTAYRRESRIKPLSSRSTLAKWRECAEWGHDLAVHSVRAAIGNGHQGIFLREKQQPRSSRVTASPLPAVPMRGAPKHEDYI